MNWKCKHCGGELEKRHFYDEEAVEGMECIDCGNTFLGFEFDEEEMVICDP